ncbi:hypothetical protein ACHAWF_013374 [Thalassiosira exigua]
MPPRPLLRRRALIGLAFALANAARWSWELGRSPGSSVASPSPASVGGVDPSPRDDGLAAALPPPRRRRRRPVFELRSPLPLRRRSGDDSSSSLVYPAGPGEEHSPDAIWSADFRAAEELLPLAVESARLRLARSGKHEKENAWGATPGQAKPDADEVASRLRGLTAEERDAVDPEWRIYLLDASDGGMGVWPYYWIQHELAPLVGRRRLHYATRSTQNERYMDSWVRASRDDPGLDFGGYYGKPINFTAMEFNGTRLLEGGCGLVQRLEMSVREDIVSAIDGYVKEHRPEEYEGASTGVPDAEERSLRLGAGVAGLDRPTDVRTFWNASVCNLHCAFRNRIADVVASLPDRHPRLNVSANTDVVGFIHHHGRRHVHPDFIRGMMTTKIIVLAQRDRWEGHSRLFEALLSGALVMTDPMVYYPHGTVDGANLVVYRSWADLELKILYYLDPRNERERMEIGRRGRDAALRHHRAWSQAERLYLNDGGHRNEYGISNRPWPEMPER